MMLSLNRRLLAFLLAGVCTVILTVAACGGDDDGGDGDDSGDSEPTATSVDEGDDTSDDEEPTATEDAGDAGDDDGDDGDDTPDGDPGSIEACSLLTEDEVGDVVGETVSEATAGDAPGIFVACQYATAAFEGVNVTVTFFDSGEEAAAILEGPGLEDDEEIDGIGERALWSGAPFYAVSVLKGSNVFDVAIFGFAELDHRAAAIELATLIDGRID